MPSDGQPDLDWADVEGGYEPPPEDLDGQIRTSVAGEERQEVRPEDFWKARPVLAHLHDFARARRAGPWAVLGTTLARVIAATPPLVQIPPTIGSNASLNLFVGLVGQSGDGKDIAQKVARDALIIDPETFKSHPLGSGEGLSHMFMRNEKGHDEPVLYNSSALVTIGEIDTMGALVQRQASTLTSQLRQAAMGEQLGFFYVDVAKRMIVPEHVYRLCLLMNIQPARSAVLLNEADGGTPQRIVWLPAGDPEAPDLQPVEPEPLLWQPPDWMHAARGTGRGAASILTELPTVAVEVIHATRLAKVRGQVDALDGHAVLTRVKIAAALAILEGRIRVDPDDWELAATVMAVSDAQRSLCVKALSRQKVEANTAAAVAEAERSLVVEERVTREKLPKVCRTMRNRLVRAGDAGVSRADLRKAVLSKDREFFDQALEILLNAGDAVENGGRFRRA